MPAASKSTFLVVAPEFYRSGWNGFRGQGHDYHQGYFDAGGEGNYALPGILAGARAEEAAQTASR